MRRLKKGIEIMESMTRLEHVLGHAKLCDFSSKHIRNFQFQLTMYSILTWVFSKKTQSICKRYPYLEAALQSAPWPMPGLTSCVLWTGGFLRTFPLLLSPEAAAPCAGPAPDPLLLLSCTVMDVIPRRFLV